jgi:hypothetical protein
VITGGPPNPYAMLFWIFVFPLLLILCGIYRIYEYNMIDPASYFAIGLGVWLYFTLIAYNIKNRDDWK